jgi:hypothetical protein
MREGRGEKQLWRRHKRRTLCGGLLFWLCGCLAVVAVWLLERYSALSTTGGNWMGYSSLQVEFHFSSTYLSATFGQSIGK